MIKSYSSVNIVAIASCAAMLTGCATCLDMDDQILGTQFSVGGTISTSSTNIGVEQFQYSNGVWNTSGSAVIDNRSYAGGTGLELNARNVNLHPQHAYPVNKIEFNFGELGGNNNININGDFRNVRDLIDVNNVSVGGALVTVNAVRTGNNWHGNIVVEGNITDFVIGGQELWVDNYCIEQ